MRSECDLGFADAVSKLYRTFRTLLPLWIAARCTGVEIKMIVRFECFCCYNRALYKG